ncbi:MAG: hypothetical protein IJW57_10185 [Spirochaetaceae bacterium]|nr:hypothetical protein [Spirochaetaceae bacterium]MBQ8561409.1 hypothetical protein [Spirochaetaceae bacterium]
MNGNKKRLFVVGVSLVLLCLVSACSLFSSDGGGFGGIFAPQSEANWNGRTASWKYNGSQVQYEVPNDVRTLSITTNEAVDVFMVKMNTGSEFIPKVSTRYLVSASRAAEGRSAESLELNGFASSGVTIDGLENVSGISADGIIRKDYVPARDFVPPVLGAAGGAGRSAVEGLSAVVAEPMKSVTQINPELGKTTKELWVDSAAGYVKKRATLQAQGDNCYIWVLEECFEATASGSKINSTKAKNLATKFESMYRPIQDVFGNESDEMINTDGLVSISSGSDTGTKVNIVVYDIEGDYKDGQQSGTLGYFWAKDYYTAAAAKESGDATIGLTNCGKYFYVDSYFLNKAPEMLYSTLAHEFQHMINFGQKTMRSMETAQTEAQVLVSQTWSNEMMSMVCEDMVQEYLGVQDKDSPIARLPWFCQNYYLSGLTDWLGGNSVQVSYAGAYAFGAYLARNYGGKELIKEIATNDYVDQEAITQALKSTGRNETFDSVFKKYAQALVLDNAPSAANAPSFNKSVLGIGEGKRMKAIDIFKVQYQDEELYPILLDTNANSRVDLRPYGFTLHSIGYTKSAEDIQLTFSSPVEDKEKVYILVQPCNHNH